MDKNQENVVNNEKPKESWLFGIIVFTIACLLANSCSKDSTSAKKQTDDYFFACTAAENEVEKQLKSPSSAQFPICSKMDIDNNGNVWTIKSYVEAQNSFGATVKNDFTVKIEILGGNKYSVKYIDVN